MVQKGMEIASPWAYTLVHLEGAQSQNLQKKVCSDQQPKMIDLGFVGGLTS